MKNSFYPKLAISAIKKNRQVYFPYIFSSAFMIAMYFVLFGISTSPELYQLPQSEVLGGMLGFGSAILAFFSVLVLLYSNNYLMKQRKKELGLYNILGMEKKHIALLLFFESLFIALVAIVLGIVSGFVFSQLVYLILLQMVQMTSALDFSFALHAFTRTAVLYLLIFGFLFFFNLVKLARTKAIDLLKARNFGEKEPKTKWLMAILGFICLAVAYTLALSITQPLYALYLFFLAVLLVIVGTYFLFIAGSILILKLMRRNKKLYYQPNFFLSISGMLYRMKQHAAGLASICILSTMVLVTMATTVSLFAGQEDVLNQQFPRNFTFYNYSPSRHNDDELHQIIDRQLDNHNLVAVEQIAYHITTLMLSDHEYDFRLAGTFPDLATSSIVTFVPLVDFNQSQGTDYQLAADELLVYTQRKLPPSISFGGVQYRIQQKLEEFPAMPSDTDMLTHIRVVAKDSQTIDQITQRIAPNEINHQIYYLAFNLEGNPQHTSDFVRDLRNDLLDMNIRVSNKTETRIELQAFFGGFLFLGLFLGILFLVATGLIIYYKQITEGYEDRERYQIMQRVGMTKEEIKAAINNQTLLVFFLPLIAAVVHLAFAFNMITRLLTVFNLNDTALFFLCTVLTALVFGLIYVLVYRRTARVYYRIVSE